MPDRSLFTEKIKSIYDKLDTQQREAVDKVEGPVMVIGGPGTGKTHIMSIRVAKILLTADTTPGNILCLADTDDGVVTLRKSLLRLIGPDAYKVNIHTCYSFCNQIIQDNLSCFNKNEIDLVSELEKIELFKKLVDTFPKHHRLKRFRGDVYYEIGNLRALFTAMKQEGWSQHFINDKIDEYINDLPKRDEYVCKTASSNFKKGEVRTDYINAEIERVEKLRAAVSEFDRFQQLMISRNRYDYDDIINWVVKAFRDFPALLISYQKQFQYFLVDDYQNLSGVQHELVQLLANPNAANIFVTGDEDQCINNQGCIHNFLSFVRHYKEELLLVELTNNYRSVQAIVNLAQSLIKNNLRRLTSHIPALRKELSSHDNRKNIDDSEGVVIREYATEREEKIHITLKVEELLKQGVSRNTIGIIYNENSYGEELEMFFAARKIPFNSKRKINVLETPLVKKIILFLNYLVAEQDVSYGGDEMLFEILHFDFFQIPAIEIAKLSVEVADKKFTTERTSIRRLLTEKATRPASKLFENRFPESLQKASAIIEKLIGEVPNSTLANLVEKMVRETGCWLLF
jgi:DNA helicase-2/ATP-dependent DNA helicase PcrA